MSHDLDATAPAVGLLEDDLRRRMYLFIRGRGAAVSRDEAAEHVGISRKLAAFHLDKMVDKGLLKTHYARPPGRSGRGAGRSSKLYEPSDLEIEVSIPGRRYDLLGEILVAAVEHETGGSAADTAKEIARARGREVGQDMKAELHLRPPGNERTLAVAEDVLTKYGYEPYRTDEETVSMRNCPFHTLSRQSPDLVCGLNREFLDGMLRGLGNDSVEASLEPTPGECCVKLRAGRR